LVLASWRVFQLLAFDDILDRPRRYVTRVPRSWREGDSTPAGFRATLGEFIECPYCLGFWIALAFFGAWEIWPHGTLVAATPLMLSAGLIGVHKYLSSD
jgi:hypothetical protein